MTLFAGFCLHFLCERATVNGIKQDLLYWFGAIRTGPLWKIKIFYQGISDMINAHFIKSLFGLFVSLL